MKIEFRAAAVGAGSYTVLADESVSTLAAQISAYQPKLTASPAIEPGFGAGGIAAFDNGNDQWVVSFSVERVHATPDAALAFLASHPATFSALGNLDLKITVGTQVLYLPACALTEFTPDAHSDQSTKIRYAFVGGSYTTTAP